MTLNGACISIECNVYMVKDYTTNTNKNGCLANNVNHFFFITECCNAVVTVITLLLMPSHCVLEKEYTPPSYRCRDL